MPIVTHPGGILNLPDGWTAEQIQEYLQWFDSMLQGKLLAAPGSSLVLGPAGSKYQPFIDHVLDASED